MDQTETLLNKVQLWRLTEYIAYNGLDTSRLLSLLQRNFFGQSCSSALEAELQILLIAMQHVGIEDIRKWCLKETMKLRIDFSTKPWTLVCTIGPEIKFWRSKFQSITFTWIPRSSCWSFDSKTISFFLFFCNNHTSFTTQSHTKVSDNQ